jgi:hypothetical protein
MASLTDHLTQSTEQVKRLEREELVCSHGGHFLVEFNENFESIVTDGDSSAHPRGSNSHWPKLMTLWKLIALL